MEEKIHKDIMDWNEFPSYDVIWTDPPWGQRMVNWFQTKLYKDTGVRVSRTIGEILSQLGRLSDNSKPLHVEYSVKGHQEVIRAMESHGHKLSYINELIQTNGRPYVLLSFNTQTPPSTDRGFEAVKNTLLRYPSTGVVFDPFAGIGKTKKAVNAAGWTYIGGEINIQRLNKQ
jgi:hypothetical protein